MRKFRFFEAIYVFVLIQFMALMIFAILILFPDCITLGTTSVIHNSFFVSCMIFTISLMTGMGYVLLAFFLFYKLLPFYDKTVSSYIGATYAFNPMPFYVVGVGCFVTEAVLEVRVISDDAIRQTLDSIYYHTLFISSIALPLLMLGMIWFMRHYRRIDNPARATNDGER